MNYSIRELKRDENKILDTFLYEAIFIPEGVPVPSKDIINKPDLQVYVKDFGENKGDLCLVAQVADEIVGAVWVRIMNDYGHIDNETPSFAISLLKEYRNYGIGTELMKQMLMKLKLEGYKLASLAVFYVKLYKYLICIRGERIMNSDMTKYCYQHFENAYNIGWNVNFDSTVESKETFDSIFIEKLTLLMEKSM